MRFTLVAVPECIDFKIAVLIYRCLHGLAPAYLSTELQQRQGPAVEAAITVMVFGHFSRPDVAGWQLSTVGDRAFPVIAARV